MALRKKRIPVFGVGVDTKADPKQVPAGELLQLVNMRQARTGELSPRNGFTSLAASVFRTGGLSDLYAGPRGELFGTAANWNSTGTPSVLAKYAAQALRNGWLPAAMPAGRDPATLTGADIHPSARMSASLSGVAASQGSVVDLSDPDVAIAGGALGISYSAPLTDSLTTMPAWLLRDAATGAELATGWGAHANTTGTDRPSVMVTGGINNANPVSPYLCMVRIDTTTTPYSLYVDNLHLTGATAIRVVNADLSTAQPWFDAVRFSQGAGALMTGIMIAYRAAGGGVSVLVYDPATGSVTGGPTNFASVDATMAIGALDDTVGAFQRCTFAVAGSTNGIRVVSFTFNGSTISQLANVTIDSSGTSNIRQLTGYLNGGANLFVVLWDIDATPTYNMSVHLGTWDGSSATSQLLIRTLGLYSRTFIGGDGQRYFIASYDSAAYPTYVVAQATTSGLANAVGLLMPGYAGGRRAKQSSLASVITSGGVQYVPLARKQGFAVGVSGVTALRSISLAAMSWTMPLRRPRELGGTFFVPGGLLTRDDGNTTSWATVPIPPESPTLAGLTDAVPGHAPYMTVTGTYFYRLVIRSTDAAGRVTRSSGSVPVSIALTGSQNAVNITFTTPGLWLFQSPVVEVYRAGPAAAGATQYNRVAELPGSYLTGATVTVEDYISDAAAAQGELLYSTGNVLENTATPSCNLLEVCGQRVWIVNAEDPTQLWFSKQYAAGSGVGFNPNNVLSITGDNRGAVTALGAQDGSLVAFKDAAVYVVSGAGPDNNGNGSFNPPQAVSLTVGCNNPSSVVATPDGIMFQGAKGIWLLDRGFSLSYIGAPVEAFTSAAQVVDASLVQGYPEARFVLASGTCLVYDYFQKRWYTYTLRTGGSPIVGCADSSLYGWCYATADGTVRQEVAGSVTDDGNGIVPVLTFPQLSLAGPNGLFRMYGVDILGEGVGAHTLQAQFELDGSGVLTNPQTFTVAAGGGTYAYEVRPPGQRCSRVKAVLTVSPAPAGGTFKLSAVAFTVGEKEGNNIPYTNRLR